MRIIMVFSNVESVFRMKFRPSKSRQEKSVAVPRPSLEADRQHEVSSYAVKALPTPPGSLRSWSSSSEPDLPSTRASFSCTTPEKHFPVERPRKTTLSLRRLGIALRDDYQQPQAALSPRPATSHGPAPDRSSSQYPTSLPAKGRAHSTPKVERGYFETGLGDFDLRPPPLKNYSETVEGITDNLFSETHLCYILSNKQHRLRFLDFLQLHKPSLMLPFVQYLDNQKAVAAVMYANAIGAAQKSLPGTSVPCAAATISSQFRRNGQTAFNILLSEALPAYITYELTKDVCRYQLEHIPNIQAATTPIEGLSEVFCLSDPALPDHPIIYASHDFFKLTQYGRDYAIGRNCRFLQGPGTSRLSIQRLRLALKNGQEIHETILNYRRDGSPFFNLLLMTPLHDDRGKVKYFLGAQIDVTQLVRHMSTLRDSIELSGRSPTQGQFSHLKPPIQSNCVPAQLRELSDLLSNEELTTFHGDDSNGPPSAATQDSATLGHRKHLCDESIETGDLKNTQITSLIPHGREGLPGPYERYLLVRPSSSLPILFASPAMQDSIGARRLQQSPLFFNITASAATLASIQKAFFKGTPNTSRIYWRSISGSGSGQDMLPVPERRASETEVIATREMGNSYGKLEMRWMSATPMVGSDGKIGVWMVVFV